MLEFTNPVLPVDIPTINHNKQIRLLHSHCNLKKNTICIGDRKDAPDNNVQLAFACSFDFEIDDIYHDTLVRYLTELRIPYITLGNEFRLSWSDTMRLLNATRDGLYNSKFERDLHQLLTTTARLDIARNMPTDVMDTWLEATDRYRNYFDKNAAKGEILPEKTHWVHELTHMIYASNLWNGKFRLAAIANDDRNFLPNSPHIQLINALSETEAIGRGVAQSFVDIPADLRSFYLYTAGMLNQIPLLMGVQRSLFGTLEIHSIGTAFLLQGKGLTDLFSIASDLHYATRRQLSIDLCRNAIQILDDPASLQSKLETALPQIQPLIARQMQELDSEVKRINPATLSRKARKAVRRYQMILSLEKAA